MRLNSTVRDGMYYFYEPMYLTEVLPPDGYSTQYGWRPKRD